jgi:O-antigen/teichoic acid export membrane protein
MTVARQVAWNTMAQTAARFGVLGLGVVTTALLTRHLGVSSYGDYIVVSVYISLFAVLFDLGVSTMLARELPRSEDPDGMIGIALGLRLALAVPGCLVAAGVALLFYGGPGEEQALYGILLALPTIVAIGFINTINPVFQVRMKMDRVALAEILSQMLGAAVIVALVLTDQGFYELVLATVLASVAYAAFVVGFAQGLARIRLSIDVEAWKRLLRIALPLGIATVIGTIYFRADALLLSLLKDSHDVGIYGVAYRFFEMTIPFAAFFLAPVFPLMSAAAASVTGTTEFSQLLQKSLDVMTIAGALVVALALPLAPELVRLVAGDAFADATGPLRILMIGAALAFLASILLFALIALDRQRQVVWLTIVALVVNLGLNLALIPPYGYMAAATIATGTQLVIVVGALYLVRRAVNFVPSLRVALKAAAAGAAVFATVLVLPAPLAVSLGVGAAGYGALLLALRVDRELDLAQVFRRA